MPAASASIAGAVRRGPGRPSATVIEAGSTKALRFHETPTSSPRFTHRHRLHAALHPRGDARGNRGEPHHRRCVHGPRGWGLPDAGGPPERRAHHTRQLRAGMGPLHGRTSPPTAGHRAGGEHASGHARNQHRTRADAAAGGAPPAEAEDGRGAPRPRPAPPDGLGLAPSLPPPRRIRPRGGGARRSCPRGG
jgi:hypothetical protein